MASILTAFSHREVLSDRAMDQARRAVFAGHETLPTRESAQVPQYRRSRLSGWSRCPPKADPLQERVEGRLVLVSYRACAQDRGQAEGVAGHDLVSSLSKRPRDPPGPCGGVEGAARVHLVLVEHRRDQGQESRLASHEAYRLEHLTSELKSRLHHAAGSEMRM
jgi:hypothetical protein